MWLFSGKLLQLDWRFLLPNSVSHEFLPWQSTAWYVPKIFRSKLKIYLIQKSITTLCLSECPILRSITSSTICIWLLGAAIFKCSEKRLECIMDSNFCFEHKRKWFQELHTLGEVTYDLWFNLVTAHIYINTT